MTTRTPFRLHTAARWAVRGVARGLTIIELMVVMMIIVVLVAAGAVVLGQMRAADADTTANVLAGAMRYVATLAVHENKTHRLVIDMDGRQWWVEAATSDDPCGRFVPDDADPPPEAALATEDGVVEVERDEDAEDALAEGAGPAATGGGFAQQESNLLRGEFEPETTVSAVLTAHHQEPQISGKVAIYFYPNGNVERAFVWVAQETEEAGAAVVTPELTLRLEALGQVYRLSEVLPESDFHRSEAEARL